MARRRRKKVALVISGGGAKGAFAVGVIKHLFEQYRETGWFSIVGGTSTGALISPLAALMAAPEPVRSQALETLVHTYTHSSTSDILEKQSIFELMQRQDCLYESDPLNDLMHRQFRAEWFEWLQSRQAPDCYVVYVNYQTGQRVVVSPKDEEMTRERFLEAMRASASVPIVMEATVISGNVCYDGGVRDLLPFGHAISLGAEVLIPIFLDPEEFTKTTGRFRRMDKVMLRTFSILVDEAGRNDFDMANLINIGVRAKQELLDLFAGDQAATNKLQRLFKKEEFQALFGPDRRLVDIVTGLRPAQPLTEDSLTFDPAKMRMWVEWGEEKAREVVSKSPFA